VICPRLCSKSADTSKRVQTFRLVHHFKPPPPLPPPAPHIASYPRPAYILWKPEDAGRRASHDSSASHPARFSPKVPPSISGNPVWPGTFEARYCTARSLSWQGNWCQIHCSKYLPWYKEGKEMAVAALSSPQVQAGKKTSIRAWIKSKSCSHSSSSTCWQTASAGNRRCRRAVSPCSTSVHAELRAQESLLVRGGVTDEPR